MHGKNQILITLDSCRWDTFEKADAPFLQSGNVRKCWSHATFTMAAHQAFFAGKLPHSFNGDDYFDTAALGKRRKKVKAQIWRLTNPEWDRPSCMELEGQNIKDGFRRRGYATIGTGAMNWFDPGKPASQPLLADFDHYRFFPNPALGDGRNLRLQVRWVLETIAQLTQPYFLFINVGETHHKYQAEGHKLSAHWGNAGRCARAQQASLEYVDELLSALFTELTDYFAIICGDHGDCWGEDGLWGHGFYHPRVMEVPMVVMEDSAGRVAKKQQSHRGIWPFRRVA